MSLIYMISENLRFVERLVFSGRWRMLWEKMTQACEYSAELYAS
jgi:hypothetical protein